MARGIEGNEISTSKKKSTPAPASNKSQKTLLGFFQRQPTQSSSPSVAGFQTPAPVKHNTASLTPAPSSSPKTWSSPIRSAPSKDVSRGGEENGLLPSPASSSPHADTRQGVERPGSLTPSRKVCCRSFILSQICMLITDTFPD